MRASLHSDEDNEKTSGVAIGDVQGDLRNSVIAGRDVIIQTIPGDLTLQQHLRNRRNFLKLVERSWVRGVLEDSLFDAVLIELGIEERKNAVEWRWHMELQRPEQPNRPLALGSTIVDVFDDSAQALLILGEPGSGKTTILLELARYTIARAEKDPSVHMPVVLNLSSWATSRKHLVNWLTDELKSKYNIPERIANTWIENNELLLLLDGLDEVSMEHREACIRTINAFREKYFMPIVVCCRIGDYESLHTKLRLESAVVLQPLTSEQVQGYLDTVGPKLAALCSVLQSDLTLQELTKSPLMLHIMTLAYQGMTVEELRKLNSKETRQKHIFDTYVQRMFERRGRDQRYSQLKTIRWLRWLAQQMLQHSQSVFLIEKIQPTWLQTGAQQRLYTSIILLGPILGVALIIGLFGCMMVAPSGRLGLMLGAGLTFGLMGGLMGGLMSKLVWGVGSKKQSGLWATRNIYTIDPVESVSWSGGKVVSGLLRGLVDGLGMGLRSGFHWGRVGPLYPKIPKRSPSLLIILLTNPLMILLGSTLGGLSGALLGSLLGILRNGPTLMEIQTKQIPNQGIQRSAVNATIGLLGGLVVGLLGGLVLGLLGGLKLGLEVGLLLGLLAGLLGGLELGGFACFQHFTLRFILFRYGSISWRLPQFLDYTAERLFMRRVGGSYIFIHRSLMDYLASLELELGYPQKTRQMYR